MEKQIKLDAEKYIANSSKPFLKGHELKGKKQKVIIKNVREVKLQFSGDCLVLDFLFRKEERSLPLNATNLKFLINSFGANAYDWIGKQVLLVPVNVINPKTKQEVESIRLK